MTQSQENAYHYGVYTGKFNSVKHQIYKILQIKGAATLDQLKTLLNANNKNDFNGRLCQLNDAGVVTIEHKRKKTYYRLTFEHEVEQVIQDRKNQQFERWLKLGKEKGFITLKNGKLCLTY